MYSIPFIIEVFFILILIGIEVYLGVQTFNQIRIYKNTFTQYPKIISGKVERQILESGDSISIFKSLDSNNFTPIDNEVEVSLLMTNSNNRNQQRILKAINSYLINNYGAAIDFHIIKEIVNRNIDSEEDAIEAKLPSPLYVGLAATMLGIIIGLFSIDFQTDQLDAIKPLIDGVKVAMAASLTGLSITTWLSISVYKRAKSKVDDDRNSFVSLIQTDLLPSIIGPGQSGMQALSLKLDEFGRSTKFVVGDMTTLVKDSGQQVKASQDLVSKIENIDLSNLATANAKVFRSLSKMMDSFDAFPAYYDELNKSLGKTSALVGNLDVFVKRTENLELLFKQIRETVETGKSANEFFNKHIKDFIKYKDSVNQAVSEADDNMKTAIATLEGSITNLFEGMQVKMSTYDETLAKAFNKSIESFNEVTLVQIAKIEKAFEDSRPKFENLNELAHIRKSLDQFNSDFAPRMIRSQEKVESALINLSNQIAKQSTNNINQEGIIQKTESRFNILLNQVLKYTAIAAFITIISYGISTLITFWF